MLIITAVPNFVSPEDHRNIVTSTPESFSDILPILRHKQDHVAVALEPPLAELTPEDCASGVLYIIESVLVFMSSTGRGFQVTYPAITLHAISRARGISPSIYCQLEDTDNSSVPDQASEDGAAMRELTIVPQDADSLDPIFEAMSLCASLHPDPDLSEEDELDGGFVPDTHFDSLDGEEELSQVGRAALAHLESIIHDPFQTETNINGNLNEAEEILSDQDETKE